MDLDSFNKKYRSFPKLGYKEVYNDILNIVIGLPQVIQELDNIAIERIRFSDTNKRHSNISEISYAPEEYIKKHGRNNTRNQSVFYGSLLKSIDDLEARIAVIAEANSELRLNSGPMSFKKYCTIGRWIIHKPIRVIIFPFIKEAYSSFPDLEVAAQSFSNTIKEHKDFEEILAFHKLVSKYYAFKAQVEDDYIFTSAFFNVFTNNFNIDGIAYPSTRIEYSATNLALHKKASPHIKCLEVEHYKFEMQGKDVFVEQLAKSITVEDNGDIIDWLELGE